VFCGTYYGFPSEVRSDGGKEFVNELLKLVLDLVGTKLAYSHEENGNVERGNREVLSNLHHGI